MYMGIKSKTLLNEDGQILPLILLVVLVAATIGFSIAGTTIKNIEETNLNEESNRAYSAAEAGLEEKLLELEQGTTPVDITTPTPLQSGALIKKVEVAQSADLSISKLDKDAVAQVNLDCGSCGAGTVTYTWDQGTALVVTKIHGNSEPYTVSRYAYNCGTVSSTSNGFVLSTPNTSGKCSEHISVDNRSSGGSDRVIRFRAMYADTSLNVTAGSGVLPIQSTVLTSTGQSGETERTVQVQRSAPIPPSILDYVLFSSQGSLSK